MRWLLISAFQFLSVSAFCATLEWDRNPETNVIGYRVYVGRVSRLYDSVLDIGNQITTQVPTSPGTTYFAVTAYNSDGLESDYSEEVFYTRGEFITVNVPAVAAGWIEWSEDLRTWFQVQYTTTGGAFTFPVDENAPRRFYRFKPDSPLPPPAPPPVILRVPDLAHGWVQASEDLIAWTTLTYTEGGTFTFPVDVNTPQRFYRFKLDVPLTPHKTKTGHRL